MNTRKKKHLYVLASWIFLFGESSLTCFSKNMTLQCYKLLDMLGKSLKATVKNLNKF